MLRTATGSTRRRCISLPHRAPRVLWTSVYLSPFLNDPTIWAPPAKRRCHHTITITDADGITEPFAPVRLPGTSVASDSPQRSPGKLRGCSGLAEAFTPVGASTANLERALSKMGARDLGELGKRIIVIKVDLRLTAALEADFTFGRYDSIDRDYVRLGDNHLEGQVEFNASALVTIVGDLSKRPPQLAIEAVELVDVDNTIDFGEVEPDYGGDQEAD
jgi:hypothetical protein